MGCVETITATKFPKQGQHFNCRALVCFHYDTSKTIRGTVIRDDIEEPFRTIIKLDNGIVVLGSECQWRPLDADEAGGE